jgi:hypothetical protein
MKPILLLLLLSSILPWSESRADSPFSPTPTEAQAAVWSGKLKGIVCALCIQSIIKRVNTLDEVAHSEIELRSGILRVQGKPGRSLSSERIEQEVIRAGYELSPHGN